MRGNSLFPLIAPSAKPTRPQAAGQAALLSFRLKIWDK